MLESAGEGEKEGEQREGGGIVSSDCPLHSASCPGGKEARGAERNGK